MLHWAMTNRTKFFELVIRNALKAHSDATGNDGDIDDGTAATLELVAKYEADMGYDAATGTFGHPIPCPACGEPVDVALWRASEEASH